MGSYSIQPTVSETVVMMVYSKRGDGTVVVGEKGKETN